MVENCQNTSVPMVRRLKLFFAQLFLVISSVYTEQSQICVKNVNPAMSRGGWQGSRAMQVIFVLGLESALSKSDELAFPAMLAVVVGVENGQPMQIELATSRACQAEPQGSAQAPNREAVFTWSEEKLLELATSLPAMRTIRHQPTGLTQRTCTTLKKLLQHHTHCHHQWIKRRDPESLQAEVAAARWAWLGPTLLVRAYESSEQADGEELALGMR